MHSDQLTIPLPFSIEGVVQSEKLTAYVHAFEDVANSVAWENHDKTTSKMTLYFLDESKAQNSQIAHNEILFVLSCHNLPTLQSLKTSPIHHKNWAVHTQISPDVSVGPFHITNQHDKAPKDKIPLIITPDAAFGSGSHPTTRGCLLAMASVKTEGISHILDMGCGSGILGIGAAKLHKNSTVIAVDIDPLAVEITRTNIAQNGVKNIDTYLSTDFQNISPPVFNLIMANILTNPLCDLASQFKAQLKEGGNLILSGFLDNTLKDVIDCYIEYSFAVQNQSEIDGWYTLTLTHA